MAARSVLGDDWPALRGLEMLPTWHVIVGWFARGRCRRDPCSRLLDGGGTRLRGTANECQPCAKQCSSPHVLEVVVLRLEAQQTGRAWGRVALPLLVSASFVACGPPNPPVLDPDVSAGEVKGQSPDHAPPPGAEEPQYEQHSDDAEAPAEPASSPPAFDPISGDPSKPWMGIEMRHTPDDGVHVEGVFPGSPAASSGLQPGDRLLTIGEQVIVRPTDVHVALNGLVAGDQVRVTLRRQGKERFLRLRLAPKPDSTELLRSIYVGNRAPSISTLRTVQGSVVPSYEQLRGNVVVLEFWATWCAACRTLSPTLNHWHDQLGARGVRVLASTVEPYEEVALAVPQLDVHYPIFVDADGVVTMAYRASALPTVFLVDQQGIVRDVMVGYDPDELERFRQKLGALLTAK